MSERIVIVGAGINGLVAANYLQRQGYQVSLIEAKDKVGGACTSESVVIGGQQHLYPPGASVLGLMQRFIYEETGLSSKLKTFVPYSPNLVFFPDEKVPTQIHRNPKDFDLELSNKWGEKKGNAQAFLDDEFKVIQFLQQGYREARTPSLSDAQTTLGSVLTDLWITGDAKSLLDHYFSSEKAKVYMAMTVAESGPVSVYDSFSALTIPIMNSGSIFDGYYGFVYQGIWEVTKHLGNINENLGVNVHTSSRVCEVNSNQKVIIFEDSAGQHKVTYDKLIFATDPLTASRLMDHPEQIEAVNNKKLLGSSGKLNLLFKQPIRWKNNLDHPDSDSAFRYIFSVDNIEDFNKATLSVCEAENDYEPGFMQVYCEGAACRKMNENTRYDRIAVFFKNLSLRKQGQDLKNISNQVKSSIFEKIKNPEDCIWDNLSTPKDLQEKFFFPGGNIDHTVLTDGQMYFDRTFSSDPENNFYGFFDYEDIYYCGAGSYPCGSVAGTPGYICSQQIIKQSTE